MRAAGDYTPDEELKRQWIAEYDLANYPTHIAEVDNIEALSSITTAAHFFREY
jgi:hypothetical protein